MTETDFAGLPISLTRAEARDGWDRVVTAFLAHSAETPDHLAQVIEVAPDFGLAHAVKGLFLILLGRSELHAAARDCHAAAMSWPSLWEYTTTRGALSWARSTSISFLSAQHRQTSSR